jgi:mycothiol synthase
MIRPFARFDTSHLVYIHNRVFPDRYFSATSFEKYVDHTRETGGIVWVVEAPTAVGYGIIAPLPGLPHIAELSGCIGPERRREGLGSRLLHGMLQALKGSKIQIVTFGTENIDAPPALFLQKNEFVKEHEEWILAFDQRMGDVQVVDRTDTHWQTFPRQTAVSLFLRLYKESFTGLPWDQPFSRDEVLDTLENASDLLFLMTEEEAIGFAWAKIDDEGIGVIEPLGIIPKYQGKGFGRFLLSRAISILQNRGARRIEIGAWSDNKKAVDLYQSMGFQHMKSITYLAYDLTSQHILTK